MNNVDLNIKIKNLIQTQINAKGYVCMIDILLGLDYLSKKDLEASQYYTGKSITQNLFDE